MFHGCYARGVRTVGRALLLWLVLALAWALVEGAPFGYGTIAATMMG
jgi:hypothetical protein